MAAARSASGSIPSGTDPALDRMVIVGKSTGGQASRLLVQSERLSLLGFDLRRGRFEQVRASTALRAELAAMLLIEPEPYIRRVLFVTTAHRGGNLARQPGVRLGVDLIRHNNPLRPAWAELRGRQRARAVPTHLPRSRPGSIDGMRADSPILAAIDAQPIAPGVAYHSIIATIHPGLPRENMTDGFVRYAAPHLDGAVSERIVTATHVCEADPEVIAGSRGGSS